MELASLQDLLIDELKDLYNAEGQLVKALPKMAKAASHPELQTAFQEHLRQTEEHVTRLEQIFEQLGESAKGKKCYAMQGLIEEGKELIDEDADAEVLDAGLIGAAQKVEHYEIAGYGTARTHARLLGNKQAVSLLEQTLTEEKQTDDKLTRIADSLNKHAAKHEASA